MKMFFGDLFRRKTEKTRFYENFAAIARIRSLENGFRGFVRMTFEETENFRYNFLLEKLNEKGNFFRVSINAKTQIESRFEGETAIFALKGGDSKFEFEFVQNEENVDFAAFFKTIFGRILFEVSRRRRSRDGDANADFVGVAESAAVSPALRSLVAAQRGALLCAPGRLAKLSDEGAAARTLSDECALCVCARGGFRFELSVLAVGGCALYATALGEELYYYVDGSRRAVVWLDARGGTLCYRFSLYCDALNEVRRVFATCVLESQRKQSLEEALAREREEWDRLYLAPVAEESLPAPSDRRLECAAEPRAAAAVPNSDPIADFAQAKGRARCFAGRGATVEVYTVSPESDNVLLGEGALPPIVCGETAIKPRRLALVDGDRRMAILDSQMRETVFYTDFEKGAVISEWNLGGEVVDLAQGGGKRAEGSLLSLGKREVARIDPRTPKGIAESHIYSKNYRFSRILGSGGTRLAVGAESGELRLYGAIGPRATNVIPGLAADPILHMDCSRDGGFLLITYKRFVLLLPTLQEGRSAFDCRFRKDAKPTPIVLRVAPQAMARYGISQLDFRSARFDEKSGAGESHIVAAADRFLALWSLSEALRGRPLTFSVKRTGEELIGSEFCYDRDELIAVGRNNLFLQSTKSAAINS